MNLVLRFPNKQDVVRVAKWRNKVRESLRTPDFCNGKTQEIFYDDVIIGQRNEHKYYAIKDIRDKEYLIGLGGLTFISYVNRNAEISLIIDYKEKGNGFGTKSVELLLDEAFGNLNMQNVYGECYKCNTDMGFWEKVITKYNCYYTSLSNRKYWQGKYHDSLYFNIDRDEYKKVRNDI